MRNLTPRRKESKGQAMTTPFTAKSSLFRRVIDGLHALEEAMDYDDTLERMKAVENNLAKLREEVRSLKGRVF
jgi:hypothetical protein